MEWLGRGCVGLCGGAFEEQKGEIDEKLFVIRVGDESFSSYGGR